MAPTILIVGATGNTGKSVVEHLPTLLKNNKDLVSHRILALTRSKNSPAAQKLAQIPNVEIEEATWTEIDADWFRAHEVDRLFIASHNEPPQFAQETQFYIEALAAGVKYAVRISTTAQVVRPDSRAYYQRAHWAIENLLRQPELSDLHWTSLQPNIFFDYTLGPAAEAIKTYRDTGAYPKEPLRFSLDEHAPAGVIDPHDVGVLAARLLALPSTETHNQACLILNGPTDISGRSVVDMIEKHTGATVPADKVIFRDTSFVDTWADSLPVGQQLSVRSLKGAFGKLWGGECRASTTSPEVLELAAPKGTAEAALEALLGGASKAWEAGK